MIGHAYDEVVQLTWKAQIVDIKARSPNLQRLNETPKPTLPHPQPHLLSLKPSNPRKPNRGQGHSRKSVDVVGLIALRESSGSHSLKQRVQTFGSGSHAFIEFQHFLGRAEGRHLREGKYQTLNPKVGKVSI